MTTKAKDGAMIARQMAEARRDAARSYVGDLDVSIARAEDQLQEMKDNRAHHADLADALDEWLK